LPTYASSSQTINTQHLITKSNAELITDPPIRITETGIISKPASLLDADEIASIEIELNGNNATNDTKNQSSLKVERYREVEKSSERKIDFDIIIYGTGFLVQNHGGAYRITGRSGETLEEHWAKDCNTLFGNEPSGRRLTKV
jgi:hypothetical protein